MPFVEAQRGYGLDDLRDSADPLFDARADQDIGSIIHIGARVAGFVEPLKTLMKFSPLVRGPSCGIDVVHGYFLSWGGPQPANRAGIVRFRLQPI